MKQVPETPKDAHRLFLALWPDDDIRLALQTCHENWEWPPQAWLAHANSLHLTLHFLGNIPSYRLAELKHALAVPFNAFELRINRAHVWTNGIAVLEPESMPDELHRLHATLRDVLQELAIPVETRPYRPHVTFARRALGASIPPDCPTILWPVQRYTLVHSQFAPAHGYQVLQHYACEW